MTQPTYELSLTKSELINLNRIFHILGKEHLKANWFTKSDIEDIYSVIGHVRTGIEEMELNEQ